MWGHHQPCSVYDLLLLRTIPGGLVIGLGGKVWSLHFISQHKIKQGLLKKSPPSGQFYLLSEGIRADHCILLTVSHLKTYFLVSSASHAYSHQNSLPCMFLCNTLSSPCWNPVLPLRPNSKPTTHKICRHVPPPKPHITFRRKGDRNQPAEVTYFIQRTVGWLPLHSSCLSLCNQPSTEHGDLKWFIVFMNPVCQEFGKRTAGTVLSSSCLGPWLR